MIRSEEKNDRKDKFLGSGNRSKEGRRHQHTQNSNSDTHTQTDKGETRNYASPTLTLLFSVLKETTNSEITEHSFPLCTRNI